MNGVGWNFAINADNFGRHLGVWMWRRRPMADAAYLDDVEKLVIRTRPVTDEVDSEYREPAIRLSRSEAQGLLDELWRCGLRPTHVADEASALRATERHLVDLQKMLGLADGGLAVMRLGGTSS